MPTTRDRDAREAVVASLLAAVVASDLSRLDYEVRWQESWQTSSWWYLSVGEAEQLIGEATDTVTVAAGLSMHRDGHIREIAVRALGISGDPRALRWLVLRCGDWVPEVRKAAFEGVDPWVTSAFAALLVDVLPILDGERFDAERAAHTLRARVDAVLREPECQVALDAGCLSADRATRRACARRLPQGAVDVKLLQQVMATNDSVVISMVVDALGTVPAVARRVGEILFAAHLPRFRAEGLWWLIKDDGPDSEGLVRSGLRDRAASVRDIAQRWMLRHGQDPAEHYRGLIHGDPVPAFRGLGDRPNLNDADLARAAAHSAVAAVRVAALRLLAGIGEEADGPLFAERFLHGSAKEGRHALEGLQRCGEANKMVDELWSTAVHQGDRRVVERVLTQVLPLVGRWKRLDIGLQAAASQDPAIAEAGLGSLWRTLAAWHNRYPTSGGDIERLRQRLETARPALTADPHGEFRPNMLESLELLLR